MLNEKKKNGNKRKEKKNGNKRKEKKMQILKKTAVKARLPW